MIKHILTICRQKPANCLNVFDHFVELALKGFRQCWVFNPFTAIFRREINRKTIKTGLVCDSFRPLGKWNKANLLLNVMTTKFAKMPVFSLTIFMMNVSTLGCQSNKNYLFFGILDHVISMKNKNVLRPHIFLSLPKKL